MGDHKSQGWWNKKIRQVHKHSNTKFWASLESEVTDYLPFYFQGHQSVCQEQLVSQIWNVFWVQLCKCPNATPCHHCLQPHAALPTTSLILCLQSSSPSCPTFAFATVFYSICLVTGSSATFKGKQLAPWINPFALFLCGVHMRWAKCNSANIH